MQEGKTVVVLRDDQARAVVLTASPAMARRLELHPDAVEYNDPPPGGRKFKLPANRVSFRPARGTDWQAMRAHAREQQS